MWSIGPDWVHTGADKSHTGEVVHGSVVTDDRTTVMVIMSINVTLLTNDTCQKTDRNVIQS